MQIISMSDRPQEPLEWKSDAGMGCSFIVLTLLIRRVLSPRYLLKNIFLGFGNE